MSILLIRPLKKLDASVRQFHQHGIEVTGIALLDTKLITSGLNKLQNALSRHSAPGIVIVVSTIAAETLVNSNIAIPPSSKVIAVGTSTQKILLKAGFSCLVPDSHDTEGLLRMPELNACQQTPVFLLKGEGGRPDLATELKERGAIITEVNLYKRYKLDAPYATQSWQPSKIRCIIVTSAEQLEAAFETFDRDWLTQTSWIVVSSRIAEIARQHGIRHVSVSHGASDETLIGFVKNLEQ